MFVSYHVMRCKGRCCRLILALQAVAAESWQLTLRECGSALRETGIQCAIVLHGTLSREYFNVLFSWLVLMY